MKRLLLIFALALLSPLAWGTVRTTTSTGGNISSGASFVGGVAPDCTGASHDQVVVADGATLDVNVNCILGTYPTTDTGISVGAISAASTTGTGVVIFSPGISFTMHGPFYEGPVRWFVGAGVTFTHDSSGVSGTPSYVWHDGSANCDSGSCAVVEIDGTYISQVNFGIAAGSGNFGGFGNGTYHSSGGMQAAWANFIGCGTSSIPCVDLYSYPTVGINATITYSTFTSSGLVELSYGYANGTTFIFNYNRIASPISSTGYGLEVQPNGGETGVTYQVENNYLEGTFKEAFGSGAYYGTDDQFIVTGNAFIGTSSVISYDGATVGHAPGNFDGNLFVNQLAASTSLNFPAGSITRAVMLLSNNTTTQHLVCAGLSPYGATTIDGMTYERQYNDGAGLQGTDSCLIPGGGSSSRPAVTIKNVVAIPAPNGYSPAQLVNMVGACSPNCPQITATHNTCLATPASTSGGFACFSGEGSTAQAGLYPTIKDNIIWLSSSAAGYGTGWYNTETPVDNTFVAVGNNDIFNITGSPYYGSSSWYSSTPGTGDLAVNPTFSGCYNGTTIAVANCNFSTWGAQQGITVSTWADIIAQFKLMNSATPGPLSTNSIMQYYYWARQGFTPTNAALHNTASDGTDIGAIPYLAPYPSQFAGLLMDGTDYTTSGSWTTPSVPASGSSYVDSIFGITANRIPAVTDCPVNSVYNPSGDCAITNRQMEVDYAKTVPWSVDENYYIADSNGWLFLYSRSSLGVYTFIRTLRTYSTSYGATRDYGSGGGSFSGALWGDGSNWLWANNASSNPDTIYYTGSSASNPNAFQLKAYNAATDTISVVHDFTATIATVNSWGTCPATVNSIDMEREGNQSDDDRYWVFGINNGSAYNQWCAVIVYDKTLDSVLALQGFGAGGLCGVSACPSTPNWVGASPSGKYALINWDVGTDDPSWVRGYGTEVYTNTLGYVGVASAYDGHGDVGWDTDGNEIYVTTPSSLYAYKNYAFGMCKLSVANMNAGFGGCRTYLSVPCLWSNSPGGCPVGSGTRGQTFFITMRGTHGAGIGWMGLSTQTESGSGYALSTGNGGWGALENDAVRMQWAAGSTNIAGEIPPATPVARIGRNHGILVNTSPYNQDYGSQANLSVNRTFTKGAWTSNFDVQPAAGCSTSTPPGTAACNYYSMYTELPISTTSYTLTVSTSGTGTGTINITNNCQTGSFTSGTTIGPCTATPNAGSVFAGWTGTLGCTGTGTCTASLTGNSTMNAVFNLAPTSAPATMQGIGRIQGIGGIQ